MIGTSIPLNETSLAIVREIEAELGLKQDSHRLGWGVLGMTTVEVIVRPTETDGPEHIRLLFTRGKQLPWTAKIRRASQAADQSLRPMLQAIKGTYDFR